MLREKEEDGPLLAPILHATWMQARKVLPMVFLCRLIWGLPAFTANQLTQTVITVGT